MADEVKNCFLYNAPAGSGKTTQIKNMISNILIDNPKDNILCITYTNRAADELRNNLKSENVYIWTIHSFLNKFMECYFKHSSILDLYFEVYGDDIKKRIENLANDTNIDESNKKYKEKFGSLDYDTVRENIQEISYNETIYNSLYYGGLSHDDLISFSKQIFDRFPSIQKKLSSRYQYIFIDEYQDTMADVLNIFYDAVSGTKCKLYLFGDRMQQIYSNYDGSFEDKFSMFVMKKLSTNYRSIPQIVHILNNLYNDSEFNQTSSDEMKAVKPDYLPKVIIAKNVPEVLKKLLNDKPDTLVLYLLNSERFKYIEVSGLYGAFSKIKKYSHGQNHTAVDVLTTPYEDNPDPLLRLLYCLLGMSKKFQKKQYGLVVQTIKSEKQLFNRQIFEIIKHNDKVRLFQKLEMIFNTIQDETKTIQDVINILKDTELINQVFLEIIVNEDEYNDAFHVPVIELNRMLDYLDNPKVSTQHGVKGESHDSVVFVAYNSPQLKVNMYDFFDLMCRIPVSLQSFNSFYYAYSAELEKFQTQIGLKIKDIKGRYYVKYRDNILAEAKIIINKFKDDVYFQQLCKEKYDSYIEKPIANNFTNCFTETGVLKVLNAYKLFYVGCSRARKNLIVLLDRDMVKGNVSILKEKFVELGFSVEEINC